ncbi:hypothetical protein [Aureimonas sp. AU20]|uniref:hypothetical protein n=1 Tax=Aureimonas sp. AU20 TaxID=1349819 RepID=UPI000721AD2B|nr:hypothetical protein [Aureimonas sp. AU20]ALN73534.1 hypothetical protein M673_12475 [Aureimonas sp. AU20]
MTKNTPTYGYSKTGEAKLFYLEEGEDLPPGYFTSPKGKVEDGDLSNGSVTPPDSTSLKTIPAPEVPESEKDHSENPNEGGFLETPTTYPHQLGSTDIHPDDENHDGIDRKLGPAETFNKPVVPRDGRDGPDDELTEIAASEDKARLDAYAKSKGVKLDRRKNFADMLDELRASQAR